jgi:cation diffusion facilitator CzcD-associated flavoprotein CzcO
MANHANGGHLPHVVIIGGGFGGLYATRALKRAAVHAVTAAPTSQDSHTHV